MGYYRYLCDLLRPLRVYRLEPESISGAELYAAGESLDAVAERLETAEREGILATAENEGLARREALFASHGAATTAQARRAAIAALETGKSVFYSHQDPAFVEKYNMGTVNRRG